MSDSLDIKLTQQQQSVFDTLEKSSQELTLDELSTLLDIKKQALYGSLKFLMRIQLVSSIGAKPAKFRLNTVEEDEQADLCPHCKDPNSQIISEPISLRLNPSNRSGMCARYCSKCKYIFGWGN